MIKLINLETATRSLHSGRMSPTCKLISLKQLVLRSHQAAVLQCEGTSYSWNSRIAAPFTLERMLSRTRLAVTAGNMSIFS